MLENVFFLARWFSFFSRPIRNILPQTQSSLIFYQMKSSKQLKILQQPKSSEENTSYCPSSRGWSPFCFWCAVCFPVCCICIHANWCLCCLCAGGVHGVRGVFDVCLSDDDSTGCRQLPNVGSGSSTRRAKVADSRIRRPAPAYRSVLTQRPPELHLCRCVPKIMEKA